MIRSWLEVAWTEYNYWVVNKDYKKLKKINDLLKSIEREGVLNGEGQPEESLLKELLENKELFYKFKIVESNDNELYMNGEESECFFSLESIRNYVYRLNLKKR